MRKGVVAIVATCMTCLVVAASAPAGVGVYLKPTFTRTSGNNTYWYNWTAVTGLDSNGNDNYTYYLCFSTGLHPGFVLTASDCCS